tara:strand:- start:153 stop:344 length:192 start_codon:yes stop_codon:yes gene_type:complete
MNNFIMMFGEQSVDDELNRDIPKHISITPQGTYRVMIRKIYLGTFKTVEEAKGSVSNYLNNTI